MLIFNFLPCKSKLCNYMTAAQQGHFPQFIHPLPSSNERLTHNGFSI